MSFVKACRFLPLLVLCCALDLAVPVAPTAAGVEFEEDQEAVHIGGSACSAKPRPAALRASDRYRLELHQRARVSLLETSAPRARADRDARPARTDLSTSDRAAPPASGEDH